ncbi:hypothetical protein BC567DRAFT_51936 [Phyllosticta citribraziliensis]
MSFPQTWFGSRMCHGAFRSCQKWQTLWKTKKVERLAGVIHTHLVLPSLRMSKPRTRCFSRELPFRGKLINIAATGKDNVLRPLSTCKVLQHPKKVEYIDIQGGAPLTRSLKSSAGTQSQHTALGNFRSNFHSFASARCWLAVSSPCSFTAQYLIRTGNLAKLPDFWCPKNVYES